jgi:hypothetical protein
MVATLTKRFRMTLRRYAPLALAALALGCKPEIDERTNATTVEYAQFDPANSLIPKPNDIALQGFLAAFPNPSTPPCTALPAPNNQVCAFARAGGFPNVAQVQIPFVRGTLASDGSVAYVPSNFDLASLAFAGAAPTPNITVVDVTNPLAPSLVTVAPTAPTTGTLLLSASWTLGHKYVVIVRGGASGVLTTADEPYVAMPTMYILRESILSDRRLDLPENQGLFPGTAEQKAAAGAQLEPLRVGYQGIYQLTQGLAGLGIVLPFEELVSMQSFQIAPGGTVTIGDGTEPADQNVATGATKALDAFTVQSSVATATLVSVTVDLTDASSAVSALSIAATSDCAAGATLGTLITTGTGSKVIPLTLSTSATMPAASTLYVCATGSANAGTVTGTVTSVGPFPGTPYTSVDNDLTSATLTVVP